MLFAPAGTAAASIADSAADSRADSTADWTAAQAIAGLTEQPIFIVPGSVAQLDEAAVGEALVDTSIQVLVLPHNGLDREDRDVHAEKTDEVQDWATQNDVTLMVIDGLQIYLPPLYNLVPTDLGELQPLLLRHNVTSLVLSGIDRLVADEADVDYVDQRADPVLEEPTAADPELIADISGALRTSGIYTDPALTPAVKRADSWDIDVPTRVAVFPALPAGSPLPDLIGPLQQEFPDDIVIVVHGEWFEVAGPQQELLDAALLELYGEYYTAISEWGAPQSGLIRILIEKIALWRTGVVADQAPPPAAPDPVNTVQPLLPWLFLLVALSIAVVVAVGLRRRQKRISTTKSHEQHLFDRAGAEMAIVAHRLQQTEDLDRPADAALAKAAERYRTARDILQRSGSAAVAREALTSASEALDRAGVPKFAGPAAPSHSSRDSGNGNRP